MKKRNIVVIGGGTGTHTLLRGLKQYQKQLNISAVVTMADSGGSTGRLRDEFGYLPVGDVRMALAALASSVDEHEELVRELFLYRFDKGEGLSGHNFGNLLLVALTDILGSEEAAIKTAARLLGATGTVVPVTTDKVQLSVRYDDDLEVTGEHEIDEPPEHRKNHAVADLSISPAATISESAEATILNADLIILGPGDLYTSILANCVVDGVPEAIKNSQAQLVYVSNLMTKRGQTDQLTASGHVSEIEKYVGKRPDFVLINTADFPETLLKKYQKDDEFPVVEDKVADCQVIKYDLLATEAVRTAEGDTLKRSLIRHDSRKLARKLMDIV